MNTLVGDKYIVRLQDGFTLELEVNSIMGTPYGTLVANTFIDRKTGTIYRRYQTNEGIVLLPEHTKRMVVEESWGY